MSACAITRSSAYAVSRDVVDEALCMTASNTRLNMTDDRASPCLFPESMGNGRKCLFCTATMDVESRIIAFTRRTILFDTPSINIPQNMRLRLTLSKVCLQSTRRWCKLIPVFVGLL
ncbi:hypothetical protein EVAR_42019_1 [Eumeta japonica]|uniref:Uncharacterized protein n=1 Tax=Eumeta variegata TaxID=151549 RepID=A0A4C1WKY3_EUMVA|nr:hypothetical protein EVAR_42019_1 [Eumeta japonica]